MPDPVPSVIMAVSWYPEQVPESRWDTDLAMMRAAGFTRVRMLDFAWSRLEPALGDYRFDWVRRALDRALVHGLDAVLDTPTASPPAWLLHAHPELMKHDRAGTPEGYGSRRNANPASPIYRAHCRRIAGAMCRALDDHPAVSTWMVDNELGWGESFDAASDAAFREFVRARFGTLVALNEAIGGAFWSLDLGSWDEVCLPRNSNPSPELRLLMRQFVSDQFVELAREQVAALREAGTTKPITTNLMADFQDIDYWALQREFDILSWDNYFCNFTLAGNSFAHHLMRSIGRGQPLWTMENAVNAVDAHLASAPGYNVIHAISAQAHGESVHTFWRWESTPSGHEQDLMGFIDHAGRPRQRLAEVADMRLALDRIGDLALPPIKPRVAICYSWQNYWQADRYYGGRFSYWLEVERWQQALFDLGVPVDCVQPGDDLSRYAAVLTPGLMLVSDGELANLSAYVERGGVLASGRKSLCKTPHGSYRRSDHPATGLFGLRVSESQNCNDTHDLHTIGWRTAAPLRSFAATGCDGLPHATSTGWWEALDLQGAKPLWTWSDGHVPGAAAAAHHHAGHGQTFYLGFDPGRVAMGAFLTRVLAAAGITDLLAVPDGMQAIPRGAALVLTNHTQIPLQIATGGRQRVLAAATPVIAVDAGMCTLPPLSWAVVAP